MCPRKTAPSSAIRDCLEHRPEQGPLTQWENRSRLAAQTIHAGSQCISNTGSGGKIMYVGFLLVCRCCGGLTAAAVVVGLCAWTVIVMCDPLSGRHFRTWAYCCSFTLTPPSEVHGCGGVVLWVCCPGRMVGGTVSVGVLGGWWKGACCRWPCWIGGGLWDCGALQHLGSNQLGCPRWWAPGVLHGFAGLWRKHSTIKHDRGPMRWWAPGCLAIARTTQALSQDSTRAEEPDQDVHNLTRALSDRYSAIHPLRWLDRGRVRGSKDCWATSGCRP